MKFVKAGPGSLLWRVWGKRLAARRSGNGRLTLLLLVFGLTGLVLYMTFWPRNKIYTLDLSTEVAAFTVADPVYVEWNVGGGALYTDPLDEAPAVERLGDYSVISLNRGVNVEVQRHGVGPVYLRLLCEGGSIGTVEDTDGSLHSLEEWALVKLLPATRPLVLPFRGYLRIGEDVASQVDSVLLGGTVSIVEEKLFTAEHYTAGQEELDPGDRVQFWVTQAGDEAIKEPVAARCASGASYLQSREHPGKHAGRLDGFIRAEPEDFSEARNALALVAHGNAEFARVERFGSGGYEIRAQPWARFINDPVLGALVAAIGILALLIEIIFKLAEFREKFGGSRPGQQQLGGDSSSGDEWSEN